MGFLDKSVKAVEDTLAYIAKYMVGKDLASYCELATSLGITDDDIKRDPGIEDSYILVDSRNCLLTVFDLQGSYQLLSDHEFERVIENLRVKMNGYMNETGHSLTFGFERDHERGLDELMRLVEPQLNAARRIGLKSDDIILDRVRRNAPLVAWEQNLLVVYTNLNIMTPEEIKRELKEKVKEAVKHKLPRIEYGQSPASVIMALKYRHDAMIQRVKDDLVNCGCDGRPGIMLSPMNVHEVAKRVRIMVNRERTSQKFRAVLPGDRFMPHGREDDNDFSDLVPPLLSYQICADDVSNKRDLVTTDELWHGNISMELGPQTPQPFKTLFASVDRTIPWRMRVDLNPGGLREMRGRQMMTSFVGMLPANRQIRESFLDLEERNKVDAICAMKMTFSTWSKTEGHTKQQMTGVIKAVKAWGSCQVTTTHGDPLAAWASTIPGFTTKNIANRMVPPLPEALSMMPFQRPATPWAEGGSLIQRTPDGKIYPIQLGSPLQDTWLELISAPPGSGKSVFLNSQNFSVIHRGGNVKIPLMTIIEVGFSGSGLIQLIRDALPEERKDEAICLRLKNSLEYAVNPFDTQLGARRPTAHESAFLVDLLMLFCTDPAKKTAPDSCGQVVEKLLMIAYEDRAKVNPNRYEPYVEKVIDAVLEESGIRAKYSDEWWEDATWYEVTDLLFEAGYIKQAALAQRQAVPVLTDMAAYIHNESLKDLFKETKTATGEPLLQFVYRCLSFATSSYALFAGRTRFELNSQTRVVNIDLNDVIGNKTPEGTLRTAAMFLFARQLAAKNYFLDDEIIAAVVPPMYLPYHLARVADIKEQIKTIAYDETHNAGGIESFIQTLIKDSREGRKWGIRIVSASQFLSDNPEPLLNAATSVYVMRGGNTADENILRSTFKVSEEVIRRLQLEATGPGPNGGNYLALFKTKVGFVAQILNNTPGPIEMWAFSTTQEDVALRKRLYKILGPYAARKLLAEHFPRGTAGATFEHMRKESKDTDEVSVVEALANKLADIYAKNQQKEFLL